MLERQIPRLKNRLGEYSFDLRVIEANLAVWSDPALREQNGLVWRNLMLARAGHDRPDDEWLDASWARAEERAKKDLAGLPVLQNGYLLPYLLALTEQSLKRESRTGKHYELTYYTDGWQNVDYDDPEGKRKSAIVLRALKLVVMHRARNGRCIAVNDARDRATGEHVRFEVSEAASKRMVAKENEECMEVVLAERQKKANRPAGNRISTAQTPPQEVFHF